MSRIWNGHQNWQELLPRYWDIRFFIGTKMLSLLNAVCLVEKQQIPIL
jgi:hypothetical protein